MAILEAASEEDEEDLASTPAGAKADDESPSKKPTAKNPQELALEVINEIIDIVLESEDANTD